MIDKAQILPKIFVVISMFLSSTNAVASYWLECVGSTTIKSKISESVTHATSKEKYITADILIHDHTFTCKGHGRKINKKGTIKNSKIILPKSINKKMLKKGTHLQVKFDYSDWRGASVSEENSITKWTALKIIKMIPLHKIAADTKVVTEQKELAKVKAIEKIKLRKEIEQKHRQLEKGVSTDEPTADDKLNFADTVDTDRDGVSNRYDVCRSIVNPNQEDSDNDGVGDACDSCPEDPAPRYENGCPLGVEFEAPSEGLIGLLRSLNGKSGSRVVTVTLLETQILPKPLIN